MKNCIFLLIFILLACEKKQKFANVGDSLFLNHRYGHINDIQIWQYGHEYYTNEWEIKKYKTKIKDVGFCENISIPEKEFYTNSTSFVGICTGVDTIYERHFGDRPFYSIRLNKHLKTHNSRLGCYKQTMYGKYYVLSEDLTLINRDSIFK